MSSIERAIVANRKKAVHHDPSLAHKRAMGICSLIPQITDRVTVPVIAAGGIAGIFGRESTIGQDLLSGSPFLPRINTKVQWTPTDG